MQFSLFGMCHHDIRDALTAFHHEAVLCSCWISKSDCTYSKSQNILINACESFRWKPINKSASKYKISNIRTTYAKCTINNSDNFNKKASPNWYFGAAVLYCVCNVTHPLNSGNHNIVIASQASRCFHSFSHIQTSVCCCNWNVTIFSIFPLCYPLTSALPLYSPCVSTDYEVTSSGSSVSCSFLISPQNLECGSRRHRWHTSEGQTETRFICWNNNKRGMKTGEEKRERESVDMPPILYVTVTWTLVQLACRLVSHFRCFVITPHMTHKL